MANSNTEGSRLPLTPPHTTAVNPASPMGGEMGLMGPPTPSEVKSEGDLEEELLLKWDDHHRSFFELAEELCHQDQFIDVTLSCGDHNFPAHKLILSVCSPYFRQLFLRNPCKHPIVVLKDVHFKYMKLLLMYMYRGEVSCPQEDLSGLLKTARSLQVRGLVELDRRREAEGLSNSITGSPIKRSLSDVIEGGSSTSCEIESRMDGDDFSLDDVRSRLHGQLEIQPVSQPSSTFHPQYHHWKEGSHHDHDHPHHQKGHQAPSSSSEFVNDIPSQGNGGSAHHHDDRMPSHHYNKIRKMDEAIYGRQKWPNNDSNGTDLSLHSRRSPLVSTHAAAAAAAAVAAQAAAASGNRSTKGRSKVSNHAAQLLAAAHAVGMPAESLDPSNPMSSVNALLAAAQAQTASSSLPISTLSSFLPSVASSTSTNSSPHSNSNLNSTSVAAAASSSAAQNPTPASSTREGTNGTNGNNGTPGTNGQDINAAHVANLQLYYYMQKVASAGMGGNPKERKECPICGKTLYDRSTWNRHMRIHTGEKPYPCQYCGRRFRTNYNKIGHEKKCPDRQNRQNQQLQQQQEQQAAAATAAASTTPPAAVQTAPSSSNNPDSKSPTPGTTSSNNQSGTAVYGR